MPASPMLKRVQPGRLTVPENAVSVASVLLLTEATLTEVPQSKPERMAPGEM